MAIGRIGENANERGVQFFLIVERDKDDTGIGDRRSGFGIGGRDDRQATSNSRDGAATARGDAAAHEEQDVRIAKALGDLVVGKNVFDGNGNRNIAKALTEFGLAPLGMASKH